VEAFYGNSGHGAAPVEMCRVEFTYTVNAGLDMDKTLWSSAMAGCASRKPTQVAAVPGCC
jgi:hypothetical protein